MSMTLMAKAMAIKTGNPIRKLVLIKLADNANDLGECWPSNQHIADQCEVGKSTVKAHIRELEKMGLLRRVFRRNGELNQSNIFLLTFDTPLANTNSGGGAGAAPRTSHLSEPVNEPVDGESAGADQPATQSEKMNYQLILDSYHELLPEMPQVKILTDSRKKHLRSFWKKFNFNEQRWQAYLSYIAVHCRWMLEDRPNGSGGFWKRKNLDYLITERCYVAVKEERANDK
ncbi:helix-turn-helix domain-containing protein [Salmonella enterica subsp. enterica serovar Fufu]|nr:helix-turn-helix domain-containing protein [Salmonella enterica subsp. enterica serovar Fufu]